MKGQINFDFIFSVTIFIILITYLFVQIFNNYPTQIGLSKSNYFFSEAYRVSELLIKDEGYPNDWNETNVERLGLSSEPYILNNSKLTELDKLCDVLSLTKIQKIKESLDIDGLLAVKISYINGTNILNCDLAGGKLNRLSHVKRVAIYNNSVVEVNVYVG
ncbi:MAG: hypothetical protein B6U88_01830 [Candidatus Aenigmarchaeota archaeon ex4484_56]|nr:MAG: hypothetical protein B6U88_01830 [Candidatus Aenigmarchaeota archaeon ex4484_56]